MQVEVFSVKLQPYASFDEFGRCNYGTEIIVEYRVDTLGHSFALSRVNFSIPNNKATQQVQKDAFLKRVEKW